MPFIVSSGVLSGPPMTRSERWHSRPSLSMSNLTRLVLPLPLVTVCTRRWSVHMMKKLQPETQLLKLYNQVCSVSLHGPHLPLYQISLEQPYSWIHHGFQPISMLPSDHASWCSCWTWFAKITKKWSEDWWTLRGINWMPNIMRCFLTAIIVLSCRLWLAYYTSLPHLLW